MARLRNFVFTLNNYTEEEEEALCKWAHDTPELVRYAVWGHEVGESKTPHLQGYMELKKKTSFSVIKRTLFGRAHIEPRRGTAQEAADYCKKDDEEPFEEGQISAPGTRTDIAYMRDLAKAETKNADALDKCPQIMKYVRGWQFAKQVYAQQATAAFRKLTTTVLWGPGGCGKTRYVMDKYGPENVFIMDRPAGAIWYDGYEGQDVLLIDDFYGWMPWGHFLRVLDGYQLRLPIKGGFAWARWTKVYITSNKHPDDWYKEHKLDDEEFHRRVQACCWKGEGDAPDREIPDQEFANMILNI